MMRITRKADTTGFEGTAKRIMDHLINGVSKLQRIDPSEYMVAGVDYPDGAPRNEDRFKE